MQNHLEKDTGKLKILIKSKKEKKIEESEWNKWNTMIRWRYI
jgi:hypothetical protein